MRSRSAARSLFVASLAAAALAATPLARAQDGTPPPSATTSPGSTLPEPVAATDGSGVMKLSDIREPSFATATDVVFVSDGYPADEQATFFAEARVMAGHVDGDPGAASLRALKKFNFHYVFVPSVDRGAPFQLGGKPGNTPFKTYLTADIMLRCDTAAADAAATKYAPDVDVVVIVARFADGAPSGETGMRANSDIKGQGSRVRIPRDAPGALVHELGHALFALGDEYDGRDGTMSESDRETAGIFPNLTYEPTGAKWASIVHGAVEGGDEWNHGIWHPTPSCRMNQCWDEDQGFCAVCVATMGSLPSSAPSDPKVLSPTGNQHAGEVLAAIQSGSGAPPWDYYISLRKSSGTTDQVIWERVEPLPALAGKVSLGQLPAGDYTLWVQAESPAGHSGWVTQEFTVTGTAPAAPAATSAPQPPPPPNPEVANGIALEDGTRAPHSGGIPPRTRERRASGFVEALGGL